jgi:hypothetical protein
MEPEHPEGVEHPEAVGIVLDIERGKVVEFARAVQADLADLALDDGRLLTPPTFLTTMNFHEDVDDVMRETGFDLARTLHAEQEFVFHGPPPASGARLIATSRVTDRFEKTGRRGGVMRFAVRTTEFRDEEGALVAESRSTSVETAAAVEVG